MAAFGQGGAGGSVSCGGRQGSLGCLWLPGGRGRVLVDHLNVLVDHLTQAFGKVEVSTDGEEALCGEGEREGARGYAWWLGATEQLMALRVSQIWRETEGFLEEVTS